MLQTLNFFNSNDNENKLIKLIKKLEKNKIIIKNIKINEFKNIYQNEITIIYNDTILIDVKRKNIFFIEKTSNHKIAKFKIN